MRERALPAAALLVLLSACALPRAATPPPTPELTELQVAPQPAPSDGSGGGAHDVIFHNGTILTMDAAQPSAEAMLVSGDTIQAVGSNTEILALWKESTTAIDLGGLTLMPGFVDAHSHMFGDDLLNDRDIAPSQQMAIEYGVTTITEMGADARLYEKLLAAAEAGELRLRVNTYLGYTTNCGDVVGDWWKAYQPNHEVGPHLTVRGLKIFTDGGSCKIPAVSVEYPGGSKGDLFLTQEQLNDMVAEAQGAGFQVAIHALGDRAVEQSLNAIEAALGGGPNTYRHRIEHNAVIRPDMLARYSQVGVVPVIFGAYPTCVRTSGSKEFKYILPEEFGRWEWPWRALIEANPGLRVAWHADYGPFRWLDPFYILWGFVTRDELGADGSRCVAPDWFKEGAITVEEALPMMTINSAYALFMDDKVGSLQPGKLADLIIISSDPLRTETDALKDIDVLMTMIGGRVEYCAAGSEALCPATEAPSAPPPSPTSESAPPPAAAPAGIVTASGEMAGYAAINAFDGDPESTWNSGADPEQWIMLELPVPQTISGISLVVAQYPEGDSVHQVWAGGNADSLTLVHEFVGPTTEWDVLEYAPPNPLEGVQFIKIVTTQSPSWVAWREIEIR